jgi:hypothetical protein
MRNMFGGYICWVGLIAVALSGCAGAQTSWKSTSTVGGKTTVTGDPETMKKEQARMEYQAAQMEKLRKASPRSAEEPIVVALYRPEISEKMKSAIKADQLFQELRKRFEKDPIIKLVDQGQVDKAMSEADTKHGRKEKPQVSADVSVFTFVGAEEVYGISQSTHKVASMAALVLTGEVDSHYLSEDNSKIVEKGNIFRNVEVTDKYAQKIKEYIKTKIFIPNEEYKKAAQAEKKQAMMDALKSLFQPKK